MNGHEPELEPAVIRLAAVLAAGLLLSLILLI